MNDLATEYDQNTKRNSLSTAVVATEFVRMTLRHRNAIHETADRLHADCEAVLQDLLTVVGFEKLGLVTGQVDGVNILCQYLLQSEHRTDTFATGWLDCMVRLVMDYHRTGWNEQRIVAAVHRELEQGVPLTPIPITPTGDTLVELTQSRDGRYPYLGQHTWRSSSLPANHEPVGLHERDSYVCSEGMYLIEDGRFSYRLACSKCGVRSVAVPHWATECYGTLAQEFALQLQRFAQ